MTDGQISTHAQLFDLTGKNALVTGGTRGIGMMMARGLLQAGARVVISSRKADACESRRGAVVGVRRRVGDPGRPVTARRVPSTRRPGHRRDGRVAHTRQQCGRDLGRTAGKLPRLGMGQGARPQRQVAVLAGPGVGAGAATGRHGRRPGPRHQHRQHRRNSRQPDAHVLLCQQQGGGAPVDPCARARTRTAAHHRQRRRARPVRDPR